MKELLGVISGYLYVLSHFVVFAWNLSTQKIENIWAKGKLDFFGY